MSEVYINKNIQYWIDRLTDLFCLEDRKPQVQISLRMDNRCGVTYGMTSPSPRIRVGCKQGKVRLSVLVHEFLHAAGFEHTNEINGWANYHGLHSSGVTIQHKLKHQYDDYSLLIVKDLTGKKELYL